MQFHREMVDAENKLKARGFTVHIPSGAYDKTKNEFYADSEEEKITFKVENDLIREHFRNIDQSDVILVLNYQKKGIDGYVGGNTFLEMGHAFSQGKKIYMLYDFPDMDYKVEMESMQPVILGGDLTKIPLS